MRGVTESREGRGGPQESALPRRGDRALDVDQLFGLSAVIHPKRFVAVMQRDVVEADSTIVRSCLSPSARA
jgi:hypothetical protein